MLLATGLLLSSFALFARQEGSASTAASVAIDNDYVRVSKIDFDLNRPGPPGSPGPATGTATLPTITIVVQPSALPEWSEHLPGSGPFTYQGLYFTERGREVRYEYRNSGDNSAYREIRVELKRVPPASLFAKDAVALDPAHNKVLFENDLVRVVRIHFGPGEKGPVVDKRPRVIILLTRTQAQVQKPGGKPEPRDSPAGSIQWSLGGSQATINGPAGPLDNIVVGLKSPAGQPK